MSFEWSRPMDVVPYPKVWLEFEVKESKNSDKLAKYRIQDVPEDRFEEVVPFYCDVYIPDEPMVRTIDAANDQDYIDDTIYFQREIVKQKLTVICLREGSDEIVGVNFLIVCTKHDTFIKESVTHLKSTGFKDQMRVVDYASSKYCPFEKNNVDKFLGSTGLTVHRKYRGLGIGVKFLEARILVAAPFDVKITHSHFSSNYSNNCADKAGFVEDLRFTFDELKENIPNLAFDGVDSDELFVKTWTF